MDAPWIDAEVSVHEDVPEPRDAAEATGEVDRQDSQVSQSVNGTGVVGRVAPGAGSQVSGDVQHVLGAQLQPSLDRPLHVGIGLERRQWPPGMAPEALEGRVEGEQVAADDDDVDAPGGHRPNWAAPTRAR